MQSVPFRLASLLAGLVITLSLPSGATAADRLHTIDGRSINVQNLSMESDGQLKADSFDEDLTLDRLTRIERTNVPDITARDKNAIVHLLGGSAVRARQVTFDFDNETCTIHDFLPDDVVVPLDVMKAIYFGANNRGNPPPRGLVDALASERLDSDILFIANESGTQALDVFIESMDEESVHFLWEGDSHAIDRSTLIGLALASTGSEAPDYTARLQLVGGNQIRGNILSILDRVLMLELAESTEIAIPFNHVQSIDITTDRLRILSEMEPTQEVHRPTFSSEMPLTINRSVGGGAFLLNKARYENGLGMHSYARVSYELAGAFDQFQAIVGIDDATEGKGDCTIHVFADREEIYSARIRGDEDPLVLEIDISGAGELTLVVEPGEDFDLSDHVDWCDARVIRMLD